MHKYHIILSVSMVKKTYLKAKFNIYDAVLFVF